MTIAEKYLKKGARVYVEGRMEIRKWTDKEGAERSATEIMVRPYRGQLIMLDARKDELGEAPLPELPEEQEDAA